MPKQSQTGEKFALQSLLSVIYEIAAPSARNDITEGVGRLSVYAHMLAN